MAEIYSDVKFSAVRIEMPEGANVIVGQSHFIKTVEDLYEALVTTSSSLKFGIAFCEASDKRLIRHDGNDEELISCAIRNAEAVAAGHVFIIVLKDGWPINVLGRIKAVQEVCSVYAATANALQVLVAQTDQGRGIIGVIDGEPPLGVETEADQAARVDLLKNIIGYKR